MSSRLALATQWMTNQPGLQNEILSQKTKNRKKWCALLYSFHIYSHEFSVGYWHTKYCYHWFLYVYKNIVI